MSSSRRLASRVMPFACMVIVGLAAMGCQSTAVAMDGPWGYGPGATRSAGLDAHCSAQARDAVIWGTLPSAWCAPYGPYWSRPGIATPYFYSGPPFVRPWRGLGWQQYRNYHGRSFGGWRGGWRGGRSGRR
jgi:hypothetical protein